LSGAQNFWSQRRAGVAAEAEADAAEQEAQDRAKEQAALDAKTDAEILAELDLPDVDMLVDYGEDYTDAATVIENLQTTYQVGKGMLKHIEEMARQEELRANPPEVDEHPVDVDEDIEEDIILAHVEPEEAAPVELEDEEGGVAMAPTPRRMKFRTEERAA